MRRLARIALIALAAATSVTAQAARLRLTDHSARAFFARQEAAWNHRNTRAFAATFTPDAEFIAQALGSDGKVIVNGRSTLAETIAQAHRFFARGRFLAHAQVDRVVLSPDGRSATIYSRETTLVVAPNRPLRTFCARTEQTLVLSAGRILSRGQTDTDVRCPH